MSKKKFFVENNLAQIGALLSKLIDFKFRKFCTTFNQALPEWLWVSVKQIALNADNLLFCSNLLFPYYNEVISSYLTVNFVANCSE